MFDNIDWNMVVGNSIILIAALVVAAAIVGRAWKHIKRKGK